MIWDGRTFLSFINTTPKLQDLEHRVRTSGPPSRLDDLTIWLTSRERGWRDATAGSSGGGLMCGHSTSRTGKSPLHHAPPLGDSAALQNRRDLIRRGRNLLRSETSTSRRRSWRSPLLCSPPSPTPRPTEDQTGNAGRWQPQLWPANGSPTDHMSPCAPPLHWFSFQS